LTSTTDNGPDLQTVFALNITLLSGITDKRIFQAFLTVKREDFLGSPPWHRLTEADDHTEISSSDLGFVYDNDVIALDREPVVNNGAPGLHACCLAALGIKEGNDILHIGAGTGYYSAILAELTGPDGHVAAYEIDPGRAARARENLSPWPEVELKASTGTSGSLPEADIIYVNAGAPYPCKPWVDALRPGGGLLFPLQFGSGFSGLLLIKKPTGKTGWKNALFRKRPDWKARFVIRANFIHCDDLPPAPDQAAALMSAFEDDSWMQVRHIYFNDQADRKCWFKADGWWLGK
jgi:protein-L-isoaspartate(D-aspartate) O-methyltransferase